MRDLYYLAPKVYREFFKHQIMYAGIKEAATNRIVGFSYILSIVLFINFSIIFWKIGKKWGNFIFFAVFALKKQKVFK